MWNLYPPRYGQVYQPSSVYPHRAVVHVCHNLSSSACQLQKVHSTPVLVPCQQQVSASCPDFCHSAAVPSASSCSSPVPSAYRPSDSSTVPPCYSKSSSGHSISVIYLDCCHKSPDAPSAHKRCHCVQP